MSVINLHLDDSLGPMRAMPDKAFPYGMVDPPYGIKEDGRKSKSRSHYVTQKNGTKIFVSADKYDGENWDNEPPTDEYFQQLKRVTERQIIFGANYFKQIVGTPFKTPRRAQIEDWIKENPYGWVVWDKCNGDSDFNDFELIWCSWMPPTHIYRFMWSGMFQGKSMYEGHIQQGNKKLNQKRIHPTEKPFMVYRYLIDRFGIKSILDTHGGSMGIASVCSDMGVDLEVYEINPRYYEKGSKRFNQHIAQQTLQFQ